MDRISYLVNRVDGSQLDIEGDPRDIARLQQLRIEGYEGRELIDALITDDWGAPPTTVVISIALANGATETVVIEYR